MHDTCKTFRWYQLALVLPIETSRIAVPVSCTYFQRIQSLGIGMGKAGTKESFLTGATVLTATHLLTLQTYWRSPPKQRSLRSTEMRRLECPAKKFLRRTVSTTCGSNCLQKPAMINIWLVTQGFTFILVYTKTNAVASWEIWSKTLNKAI